MALSIIAIVVSCIFVVVIAIAILIAIDRFRGTRDSPGLLSTPSRFEQMIRSPDWDMVEQVLGEVPPRLRALYASDMVLQQQLDVVTGNPGDDGAYEIATFEALRPEWRESVWPDLQAGCLTFAGDGFGNHFFLRAGSGPLWPVFFYDHEGGE